MEVKDVTSTSFGYIIAFLLPGIVALYGCGYWSTAVHDSILIKPGANPEATLGPSLLFVLTALMIGLIVNAFRALLFEHLVCSGACYASDFFAKLGSKNKMVDFRVLVDELFRYHQFYGSICISMVPLFVGWFIQSGRHQPCLIGILAWLGFLLVEWRLGAYAAENYRKFVERVNLLVA